jgi:hypothetical protein
MGCGCKKKKAQQSAINTAESKIIDTGAVVNTSQSNVSTTKETKDYQDKVKDALKQLMDLKRRKRTVRF